MKNLTSTEAAAEIVAKIKDAHRVLEKILPPTPLILNPWLSETYGCQVYLKMENMQPIGSFKIRGATYRVASLDTEEKKRGVIAASAGNHAQGVAWGSRRLGVRATIIMPKSAPLVKIQNTKALGAEVVLFGENYDEAYAEALRRSKESGAVYVHAFDDDHVIAGQATVGLELLNQLPSVDAVISSIGGGGLLAGVALAMKTEKPDLKIWGCQAEGAPSMERSILKRSAVTLDSVHTFADGIKVLKASEHLRDLLQDRIEGVLLADDEAMAMAVLTLAEKAKIIAEGAGALPLAVLEQVRAQLKGKNVVLVVSGGNIDVNVLNRILDRGLVRSGRRIRLNVWIEDRPGSLAHLTALLANEEANILQAIHDRGQPSTLMDQTEVELTLETRGHEHSQKLITALRGHVIKLEILN